MDIAKYIGQYLLKNSFCYIHGLGNLEISKKPAFYDGKSLQAPTYEIVLSSGGSIDDNFANFIATNEQISISKAANQLREFSIETRRSLQAGNEVDLPGIGKLMEHNGKTIFITDPQFRYTPPGIPTVKNSKQLDDQKSASVIIGGNASNSSSSGSINWSTIIIIGVVVLILAAAGFGIYYYTKMQPTPEAPVTKIDTTTVKDTTATPIPISVDSSILKAQNDSLNALKADSMTANQFKFVIGTYAALDRALNRYNKLKLAGTNVELATRDSLTYYVLTIIDCKPVDTTLTKDSLQRFYGYRPVTIYGQ